MVRKHDFIKHNKDYGVVVDVTPECVYAVMRRTPNEVSCVPHTKLEVVGNKHPKKDDMEYEIAVQLKVAKAAAEQAELEAVNRAEEAVKAMAEAEKASEKADSALEMAEKRAMTAAKLEESAKLAGNTALFEKSKEGAREAAAAANEAAEIAQAESVAADVANQTAENAQMMAVAASKDADVANESYENAVAELSIINKVRVMVAGTKRKRKRRRTRRA
jgi:hypothetical protein